MENWTIKGNTLEYYDEEHLYICNGIIIPSVTQFMASVLKDDYVGVNPKVLQRASQKGTAMHKAIEEYELYNIDCNLVELHNYKFLKKHYKFEVNRVETPVLIFYDGEPILAGRLDQVIKIDGVNAINDFKRIANINKQKVAMQLNLYALGVYQSYDIKISKLYCTQLREDKRKFIELPMNELYTLEELKKYVDKMKEEK